MILTQITNFGWSMSCGSVFHLRSLVIVECNVQICSDALKWLLDFSSLCIQFKIQVRGMQSKIVKRHCDHAEVNFSKTNLASNVVTENETEKELVGDLEKAARMVSKASVHAYVGVQSLSLADLEFYRLLRSHSWKLIHLLRYSDVVTLQGVSQLNVEVPDRGISYRIKVHTFHELCGRKRSFTIDIRLQTEEITWLQLQ